MLDRPHEERHVEDADVAGDDLAAPEARRRRHVAFFGTPAAPAGDARPRHRDNDMLVFGELKKIPRQSLREIGRRSSIGIAPARRAGDAARPPPAC